MDNKTKQVTERQKPVVLTGRQKFQCELFDWVQTFAQALFVVVVLFTFFCRSVTVDGESMMHTLENRDRLIVSDFFYTPKRGDIVVVHDMETEIVYPPETMWGYAAGESVSRPAFRGPIIKRVIATEGETVLLD